MSHRWEHWFQQRHQQMRAAPGMKENPPVERTHSSESRRCCIGYQKERVRCEGLNYWREWPNLLSARATAAKATVAMRASLENILEESGYERDWKLKDLEDAFRVKKNGIHCQAFITLHFTLIKRKISQYLHSCVQANKRRFGARVAYGISLS